MTSSTNHTNHCIEMLRQAVMCAADLTLEKLDPEDITSPFKPQRGNSGWGNFHTCRDWTRLAEMVRQRGIVKSKTGWIKVILRWNFGDDVNSLDLKMTIFLCLRSREKFHTALTTVEVSECTRQSMLYHFLCISARTHPGRHLYYSTAVVGVLFRVM